jgi:hypothetical protein
MRVLLVWEEIPETTRAFDLSLTKEEYEKILLCHGLFINSSDMNDEQEKAIEWLQEYIEDKKPVYNDNEEIGAPPKIDASATLIVSGFFL